MFAKLDNDGITRIADLMLKRNVPSTRHEAYDLVRRHLGAYDLQGEVLIASVDAYFDQDEAKFARH